MKNHSDLAILLKQWILSACLGPGDRATSWVTLFCLTTLFAASCSGDGHRLLKHCGAEMSKVLPTTLYSFCGIPDLTKNKRSVIALGTDGSGSGRVWTPREDDLSILLWELCSSDSNAFNRADRKLLMTEPSLHSNRKLRTVQAISKVHCPPRY